MKENNIPSASELREIAKEVNKIDVVKILNEISEKAKWAALEGKYEISVDGFIPRSVADILKLQGYSIEYWNGCQWDPAPDTTIISWK